MNYRKIFCLIAFFYLFSPYGFAQKSGKLVNNVDPFIGTGGHGHTFPGATLPMGMVQLSPDTYDNDWDWCSGYHASDNSIMGFSHTHLSGTGCADYGDILLMPTTGQLKINPGSRENPTEGYRSRFSHENEKASPGYYSVFLDDHKVKVELTATQRAGFHKYSFPASDQSNIIIDLNHGIGDECINSSIKITGDSEVEGFRRSKGWNGDHTVYFVAKFSKPFKSYGVALDGKISANVRTGEGKTLKGFLQYTTRQDEAVLVKIGISHLSIEGARKNLEAEIKGWDFEKIRNKAAESWEKELSRIIVEGGSRDQQVTFYTALYHSYIAPNIFNDVDGRYMGMDGKAHTAKGFNMYTVFSLWDTFRALHPLMTITNQKRTNDFINTFYAKYKESGLLPVWELSSFETNCMIGYHSIPVIFDAYMKGLRNYDAEKLFEAMKHSAEQDQFGLKSYKAAGYVQADKAGESVSRTLEYAYDDWCISKMAEMLGKKSDAEKYGKRALSYMNIFDGSTGFMRGRTDAGFVTPFNPYAVTHEYTEANAWQYNLFVPHDVKGLMNLFGSKAEFAKRVNELFETTSKLEGHAQSDISGLIGQYAHGNEPSHHMAYLFNYIGQGWKTQSMVRKIMDELYVPKPDGLSGNEDCGQMSAWYVLSAIGFYPACPGTNEYLIGSPIFKKVTINLENGKHFVINAPENSSENKYIQSVKKNGSAYNLTYFKHEDIMKGSEFTFVMGKEPNKSWGTDEKTVPYSFSRTEKVSLPFLQSNDMSFIDSTEVSLGCRTAGAEIHYTLDGTLPTKESALYTKPLTLKETKAIWAAAFKPGSEASSAIRGAVEKIAVMDARPVSELVRGLKYEYHEGSFNVVNDILKVPAKRSGQCDNVIVAPEDQKENIGFIFSGYINIPRDGMYKFYTKSDDGSVLYLDDKLLVNNDGLHGETIITAAAALKAGYHSFRLLYSNVVGGGDLEAGVEGPGVKLQAIPQDWYYREK